MVDLHVEILVFNRSHGEGHLDLCGVGRLDLHAAPAQNFDVKRLRKRDVPVLSAHAADRFFDLIEDLLRIGPILRGSSPRSRIRRFDLCHGEGRPLGEHALFRLYADADAVHLFDLMERRLCAAIVENAVGPGSLVLCKRDFVGDRDLFHLNCLEDIVFSRKTDNGGVSLSAVSLHVAGGDFNRNRDAGCDLLFCSVLRSPDNLQLKQTHILRQILLRRSLSSCGLRCQREHRFIGILLGISRVAVFCSDEFFYAKLCIRRDHRIFVVGQCDLAASLHGAEHAAGIPKILFRKGGRKDRTAVEVGLKVGNTIRRDLFRTQNAGKFCCRFAGRRRNDVYVHVVAVVGGLSSETVLRGGACRDDAVRSGRHKVCCVSAVIACCRNDSDARLAGEIDRAAKCGALLRKPRCLRRVHGHRKDQVFCAVLCGVENARIDRGDRALAVLVKNLDGKDLCVVRRVQNRFIESCALAVRIVSVVAKERDATREILVGRACRTDAACQDGDSVRFFPNVFRSDVCSVAAGDRLIACCVFRCVVCFRFIRRHFFISVFLLADRPALLTMFGRGVRILLLTDGRFALRLLLRRFPVGCALFFQLLQEIFEHSERVDVF